METFYTDNQNYNADKAALIAIEPAINEFAARLTVTGSADAGYTVAVTSKASGTPSYAVVRAGDGNVTRTCPGDRQGLQERRQLVVSGTSQHVSPRSGPSGPLRAFNAWGLDPLKQAARDADADERVPQEAFRPQPVWSASSSTPAMWPPPR